LTKGFVEKKVDVANRESAPHRARLIVRLSEWPFLARRTRWEKSRARSQLESDILDEGIAKHCALHVAHSDIPARLVDASI